MFKKFVLFLLATAAFNVSAAGWKRENPEKYWDFEKLKNAPGYREATEIESQSANLKALYLKGYGAAPGDKTISTGNPNPMSKKVPAEFFVYYGEPAGKVPEGGFPGIVLIHGGGGTAYPQFVKRWIAKGYAVIALDWYNQRPSVKNDNVDKKRIPLSGGRRHDHVANVANMVLCHSFLRAQKNVNPEKTAFVGLSWGSWYGAMLAAVDNRFKGGIEIYCGDIKKETSFINGRFHHAIKVPMFWVVSTNDQNMTLASVAEAYKECPTTVTKSQVIRLPHAHVGFNFDSCARMAEYFTRGGVCLPVLADLTVNGNIASAKIMGTGKGIKYAILCYTDSAEKKYHKRLWKSVPAIIKDGVISAEIPNGARQFYISAYDGKGKYNDLCGSTAVYIKK